MSLKEFSFGLLLNAALFSVVKIKLGIRYFLVTTTDYPLTVFAPGKIRFRALMGIVRERKMGQRLHY